MKKNNIYKPRYKIAFQAKSKVWAYKNSRLRHFYSIRCRKLYRDGFFRKNVLAATTLKWTVARRFIKPYSHSIRGPRGKAYYKHTFYLKQQLRHFYGKLTEVAFRSIYKAHLLNTWDRNKSFFGALEQRADMFLYRMRLLPTIYACNQFIHHQGLLINRKRVEKCPSSLIKIGYFVSLPKMYWSMMANYMIYRVYYRVFGKFRIKIRMRKLLSRKLFSVLRRKKKSKSKYKSSWKDFSWKYSKQKEKDQCKSSFWRTKVKAIKMILQVAKIAKSLENVYLLFGDLSNPNSYLKYKYNEKIVRVLVNLFQYRSKSLLLVNKFISNYILFFNLIGDYISNKKERRNGILKLKTKQLELDIAKLKSKSNKKGNSVEKVNSNTKAKPKPKPKVLPTPNQKLKPKRKLRKSPRILILIALKNYLNLQEFKSHVNYIKEQSILLEALVGLEVIDLMSYNQIIKKYNLDIEQIFKQKTIPTDQLIHYMKNDWLESVKELSNIAKERFILHDKLSSYYLNLSLRGFINKFDKRWKRYYDKLQRKKAFKPSALTYFLVNRKYKERRKQHIFKLKKVHWYIPKYIYFDVRTLRATLLYAPRTNEIVFPFQCSVSKIFSFYKSLGV